MTTPTVHTAPHDYTESAYARACRLIETELGGRRVTPEPANWAEQHTRTRRHKTALITAVSKTCHVSGVVEAFRVVEAIYPFLDADGFCTDAALTAARNIIDPDAHTWPMQRQAENLQVTGESVNRALAEARSAVADHD